MEKKGQFSPLFKYIFMLVAGAFILIFFIGFAMSYMGGAGQVESAKSMMYFDNDLALKADAESLMDKDYDLKLKAVLTFSEGEIFSGRMSQKTSRIIYSPETLSGSVLYIGSMAWMLPYKVDNFFYVTNAQFKYYIIYDSKWEEYVRDDLGTNPIVENLGIEMIAEKDLARAVATIDRSTADYEGVRFIYFGDNAGRVEGRIGEIGDLVVARPESIVEGEEYGTVGFGGEELPYLGRAMLFGAFFAADEESYAFNFERAQERFAGVTDIYIGKAKGIGGLTTLNCNSARVISGNAGLEGLKRQVGKDIGAIDPGAIYGMVGSIVSQNKNPGEGCPDVF
ncbi:MAG: hypothetical protein ABIB71_01390 [Candidatus Woesearchaeota archaeon]